MSEPTWSELELFDVISPNAVSSAYDGSCWAIDWGRNEVVKIGADGDIKARTTACEIPDIGDCNDACEMIHPLALDCGGDPTSCFVADYDGNQVYKLNYYDGTGSISLEPSAAKYYRPKAIALQRYYDEFNHLVEQVWVADKWNYTPTPAPGMTWTPVFTATPVPPTVPGQPTQTPVYISPTPFPEQQRITRNEFSDPFLQQMCYAAIPMNLFVSGEVSSCDCWISDRDAGNSGRKENFVRLIEVRGDTVTEKHIGVGEYNQLKISRPVDAAAVGLPPSPTPTQTQ